MVFEIKCELLAVMVMPSGGLKRRIPKVGDEHHIGIKFENGHIRWTEHWCNRCSEALYLGWAVGEFWSGQDIATDFAVDGSGQVCCALHLWNSGSSGCH